jgi:hypothetical protein
MRRQTLAFQGRMKRERTSFALFRLLLVIFWVGQTISLYGQASSAADGRQQGTAGTQSSPGVSTSQVDADLHRAARQGDLPSLRSGLQQGADPNAKDSLGHTALFDAVAGGQIEAARALLNAGAKASVVAADGRTPLIEAAAQGRLDIAQLLVQSGADLNTAQRGSGTALQTAERNGHNDVAAFLLQSGAPSSGKSVGDTVCVRPWKGDGYCGAVTAVNKTEFTIRITKIVGCESGCAAKADCSAGKTVGGTDGLHVGNDITTRSWCLTHTGVQP